MIAKLDTWPCGVWPTAEGPCGAVAAERLVMLDVNLPDFAVCASHLEVALSDHLLLGSTA